MQYDDDNENLKNDDNKRKHDDDFKNLKHDEQKRKDDDKLKSHQSIEFLKKKLDNDKKKEKEKKMENSPSPKPIMAPCIRCGKTHIKGAKCPP